MGRTPLNVCTVRLALEPRAAARARAPEPPRAPRRMGRTRGALHSGPKAMRGGKGGATGGGGGGGEESERQRETGEGG